MPTGYTADIASGKLTDFNEYALQCARAFGACIMLRDEPMSSEIPAFEPSTYHREAMEKAKAELSTLDRMTTDDCLVAQSKELADAVEYRDKRLAEMAEELQRYETMLAKAKAFVAPTPDHGDYARFLVTQIEEAIKFDCDTSYYQKPIERLPIEQWLQERRALLLKDIERHAKEQAAEEARTVSRNEWVNALKRALVV